MFSQLGAVASQSLLRSSMVWPDSTWLAGGAAGAAGRALPDGAVAVRSAAGAAGTVPGMSWKKRNTLVATESAVPPVTAALMALTLVRVAKVEALVVAMTCTFHHSGRPLFRVPTTWSWEGMGTLSTDDGEGLPGRDPAIRERSMVGGWSMHVAVDEHCVGGAGLKRGIGM